MLTLDEEALVCDLAETYGVFNYRSLPVDMVATLSVGLRANSRIKMKQSGSAVPIDTLLLAGMYDKLAWIAWSKTEDATQGIHRPKSILSKLIGVEQSDAITTYQTGMDFESKRKELVGRR